MRPSFTAALRTLVLAFGTAPSLLAGYNPMLATKGMADWKDLVVQDEKRAREIPIRVYFSKDKTPAAVILFSHGLGGNREGSAFLGKHWASRGFVAVFMQHPGSDDTVWKAKPVGERMASLKKAADLKNFQFRVQDVPAVIDQLEVWNNDATHPLAGRLDLKRLGMSGHSFGAVTTQATSGQSFALGKGFTDARIKAAVVMSPSGPANGDTTKAFHQVKIPWMLLTGTKDGSPLTGADPKSRLVVFPALPLGRKYELVLDKAEHSAFTERALPGEKEKRNPNHHQAILAVTTAFWESYLREEAEAKNWLDGEEVRGVLERDDRWQKK